MTTTWSNKSRKGKGSPFSFRGQRLVMPDFRACAAFASGNHSRRQPRPRPANRKRYDREAACKPCDDSGAVLSNLA
jgi:hypothetical protein